MNSFIEFETERRRLAVVRMLQDSIAYTADDTLLLNSLANYGHRTSRDRLRVDLAWLEEQGLVLAQQVGGVWVVTLTARGSDCADGLTDVPGVARPRPGE